MRTHTTLTLRNLIRNDMDASKHQMSQQQIDTWLQIMPDIYKEMIDTVRFFTHSIFQKQLVRRQVSQMHKEAILLLDALDKLGTVAPHLSRLKAELLKCLEQLMEYLTENCGKYLDPEVHIPLQQLRIEKLDMESRILALEAQMKQVSLSSKLQKAILEAFQIFHRQSRCSYAKLGYLKDLACAVKDCMELNNKSSIHDALAARLVSLNFNSNAFITWYEGYILEGLAELYEPVSQQNYLQGYEIDFSRPPFRNYAGYYDKTRRKSHELLYAFICKEKSKLPAVRNPYSVSSGQYKYFGRSSHRARTIPDPHGF